MPLTTCKGGAQMISANISNKLRKEIYKRDWYMCALCSSGSHLQIHHLVPRGQGGSDFPDNLVTLCSTCHAQIHGYIPFDDPDMTIADAEQLITEYLADYYVDDWYPYK